MRTIYRIAKKELQILFYSPVAWFLLIVFVMQTAMFFLGKYKYYLHDNEWGDGVQYMASSGIFVRGLWGMVSGVLYFYIPLLTMGIVSREFNSGSIKLLYSSPVTNSNIILGKYFSLVTYIAVLCLVLFVYVVIAYFTVMNFELEVVMTGLLGLFLLGCTYISVGIFLSSLTSYQFVAAIGTFIVLMLLSLVGGLWQEYDLVRDVTYWLSIDGRALTFISGMICSEDMLYFPIVTSLFLLLTIIRLNAVRQKIPFAKTFFRNLVVILGACFLGYLSSRPKLMAYHDSSSTKWNTLTETSQDIVSRLDGGLKITGYANVLFANYHYCNFPYFIQINRELFKKYERFKPEMELKVVYYYDSITEQDREYAANHFKMKCEKEPGLTLRERARKVCESYKSDSSMLNSPEEIRKTVDLTGERTFVWLIESENGRKTWLRTYADDILTPYPSETEISAALKGLVMDLPKVGFITGYGMRSVMDGSPRGYSTIAGNKELRESLLNQGFDVVELDLKQDIPDDIDILTFADVREPFSVEEEERLEKYVERGGNLFILGEPRRREVMNPFLNKLFGVELTAGTLVQYRNNNLRPDALQCLITTEAKEKAYIYGRAPFVVLPTASGIEKVVDKGFTFIPLLKTDSIAADVKDKEARSYRVWNELESLNSGDELLKYNPSAGEVAKEYYPAVALTRVIEGKEQRIVIIGDADCISNGELEQNLSRGNVVLITGTYQYLSNNELPVDTRREESPDTVVYIDGTGFRMLRGGLMIVFPLLFLGIGLFLWLRRRGR